MLSVPPQWIIEKKRDGHELSSDEISGFIDGFVSGRIPDYQMSALAMAIYFKGMSAVETAALTQAMIGSGEVIDTSSIALPKIDKHSTGGVGDKISLVLAPLVACVGIAVPMISGRGLGTTGGTLDKLESIAGYRTDLDQQEFLKVVEQCGCSITGQTATLVPADKKLYALRDVTATVPSIPLIVSSIMSKKLAEGLDGLVLDVKVGKGAFMRTLSDAKALARAMVEVGKGVGKKVTSLITDMDQPLGRSVGNALEIREVIDCLKNEGPEDIMTLTVELAVQMVLLSGQTSDPELARANLTAKLRSGEALSRFKAMVRLHGGDPGLIENPERLAHAKVSKTVVSKAQGYIAEVDAELIGKAAILVGAGRKLVEDKIDFGAGVSALRKIGERVSKGETLCVIHGSTDESVSRSQLFVSDAFKISDAPVQRRPLIIDRIIL